jgi:hypothetical protein
MKRETCYVKSFNETLFVKITQYVSRITGHVARTFYL